MKKMRRWKLLFEISLELIMGNLLQTPNRITKLSTSAIKKICVILFRSICHLVLDRLIMVWIDGNQNLSSSLKNKRKNKKETTCAIREFGRNKGGINEWIYFRLYRVLTLHIQYELSRTWTLMYRVFQFGQFWRGSPDL